MQQSARRLRNEIDAKVEEGVQELDSSHHEAVEGMMELYKEREDARIKMVALKEVSG